MIWDDVAAIILSLPETEQSSHFGTMDFRVRGKIFAAHPNAGGMTLKLTPEQQEMLIATTSEVFAPLPNRWGAKGWTTAQLAALDDATARSALWMAWGNVVPKALARLHRSD